MVNTELNVQIFYVSRDVVKLFSSSLSSKTHEEVYYFSVIVTLHYAALIQFV